MYVVKNIRAKIASAARERSIVDLQAAKNYAKATSEFFHGVYQITDCDAKPVCYYVGGRRYLREDTALARA